MNKNIAILRKTNALRFAQKIKRLPSISTPASRLIFALDATGSRQFMWDKATDIQADMFDGANRIGKILIQLVYYRGYNEFMAYPWHLDAQELIEAMTEIRCRSGATQIAKVLLHTIKEYKKNKVKTLVFVGDCCEEDDNILYDYAARLKLFKIPCFMFLEGYDSRAELIFSNIAKISRGAFCRFDANSVEKLRQLLINTAIFATGGKKSLLKMASKGNAEAQLLIAQMTDK